MITMCYWLYLSQAFIIYVSKRSEVSYEINHVAQETPSYTFSHMIANVLLVYTFEQLENEVFHQNHCLHCIIMVPLSRIPEVPHMKLDSPIIPIIVISVAIT